MEEIEIKYWAPFLHKKLNVGDKLKLLYTRINNYGQKLYIYQSEYGNQYLHEYELDIILLRRNKLEAKQKQIGGNHYKKLKIQPMEYNLANNLNYAQAMP